MVGRLGVVSADDEQGDGEERLPSRLIVASAPLDDRLLRLIHVLSERKRCRRWRRSLAAFLAREPVIGEDDLDEAGCDTPQFSEGRAATTTEHRRDVVVCASGAVSS